MFANRYRGVPSSRLSFNLLNEPARATRENYLKVFRRTIEAIQQADPQRLILVDGMNVGRDPVPEFLAYKNLVQATRGYHPGQISHYRANWVKGSDQWPEPTWPLSKLAGHLYGPVKPEFQSPLVLRGQFAAGTEISLKLHQVSQKVKLVAKADGRQLSETTIDPQAAPGEWKRIEAERRWPIHEAAKEVRFTVTLPAAAREVAIENAAGDWLKFSEVSVRWPDGRRRAFPTDLSWGVKQTPQQLDAEGRLQLPPGADGDAPLVEYLKPWREISARGAPVFVGEWGSFNKTPHAVTLAWMKSWLEQWKQARYGWALWNFRGSFGILDSGRSDVKYEDFHGHQLDREMLKLLQQYLAD
jgi:hypothetical protein